MKEKTKEILFELGLWVFFLLVGGILFFTGITTSEQENQPQASENQSQGGMNPVIKYYYFRKIGGFK